MSLHCNVNWRIRHIELKNSICLIFCFSVRRAVRAKGSVLNASLISLNKNLAKLRRVKQHMACICTPNTPSPASPPVRRPKMLKTSLGPVIYDSYIYFCMDMYLLAVTYHHQHYKRCVLYFEFSCTYFSNVCFGSAFTEVSSLD